MDRHRSISGKIDNFFRNFPSGFTSNSENQDIVREKGKYRTQTLETAAISGKILVVKRVFPINMSDFICGMSSSGQKIIAFLDGWATKFRPFSNGCFRFYFDLDIDAGSYSFFQNTVMTGLIKAVLPCVGPSFFLTFPTLKMKLMKFRALHVLHPPTDGTHAGLGTSSTS